MGADAVRVLAAGLALGGRRRRAMEGLAEVEESAVDHRGGGDAQGVALAASYGHALVECGALGGLQFDSTQEFLGQFSDVSRECASDPCHQPCHRYGFGGNLLSLGVDQLWCDVG
ncbi:hypothetical protein [Streptomyces sp. NPDC058545]|uniref:hypothetical protein n=1 Tax=Streptomyces sp. NPDC058545 TaxID=3346544 RepID=UPI00365803AB